MEPDAIGVPDSGPPSDSGLMPDAAPITFDTGMSNHGMSDSDEGCACALNTTQGNNGVSFLVCLVGLFAMRRRLNR